MKWEKVLTMFLPLSWVLRTKRNLEYTIWDIKNPKAIHITIPENFYLAEHIGYFSPHYPKWNSARNVQEKLARKEDIKYSVRELDQLPLEFFENRGIKDKRVPFEYWWPMYKQSIKDRLKHNTGLKVLFWLALAVAVSIGFVYLLHFIWVLKGDPTI